MDRDEDVLSFTSLVQPNMPERCPRRLSASTSVEFRQACTAPPSSPADLLFTNGKIVLWNNPSPIESNGSISRRRCLRKGSGRSSADSAPKRVSFQENLLTPKGSTATPLSERRNEVILGDVLQLKSKREAKKSKGLLGSIILACRECRAVEPSTKSAGRLETSPSIQ